MISDGRYRYQTWEKKNGARTSLSWADKAELSKPRKPRFLRPELCARSQGIGRGKVPQAGGCSQWFLCVRQSVSLVSLLAGVSRLRHEATGEDGTKRCRTRSRSRIGAMPAAGSLRSLDWREHPSSAKPTRAKVSDERQAKESKRREKKGGRWETLARRRGGDEEGRNEARRGKARQGFLRRSERGQRSHHETLLLEMYAVFSSRRQRDTSIGEMPRSGCI